MVEKLMVLRNVIAIGQDSKQYLTVVVLLLVTSAARGIVLQLVGRLRLICDLQQQLVGHAIASGSNTLQEAGGATASGDYSAATGWHPRLESSAVAFGNLQQM